jgi:uncharacterized protein
MSEENVELVKRAYEAFDSGDMQSAVELFDAGVEIDVSRTNPEGRVYQGIEGFLELMAQWLGTWDDYTLELLELIDAGESGVVAVMRERGKIKGSESWTEHIRGVVWTVSDTRIAKYEEHQDRAAALEAAGLSE